jgi:type IV pilus assembly protein PilB
MTGKQRLGEILLGAELINRARLEAALRLQALRRQRLGSTLLEVGFVREDDLLHCLSMQLQVPSINLREVPLGRQVLRVLPARTAERHHVFPVSVHRENGRRGLILAMADPTDLEAIREIEFEVGMRVHPTVTMESSIMRAIARYYRFRDEAVKTENGARLLHKVLGARKVDGGAPTVEVSEAEAPPEADSRQLARELLSMLVRRGLLDRRDLQVVLRMRAQPQGDAG